MEQVPIFAVLLFILTTLGCVWQFFKAAGKSKAVLAGLILWMVLQSGLGISGFYRETGIFPPRFMLLIAPGFIFVLSLFLFKGGRKFLNNLGMKELTLLHLARIPVETCLYFLLLAKLIPVQMTFEGNNFDILSGLSAGFIYWMVFIRKKAGRKWLLFWNIACLGLLVNIIAVAVLSAKTPFQQIAFAQPNIGVTFFPFVWLPSVMVPLVLLSHLAVIRKLVLKKNFEVN